MKSQKKKFKHPIDMRKYQFLQVYWLNHWHICEYYGWEPISETDIRNSRNNAEYKIVYDAAPFNKLTGKPCLAWESIHHSRVLPFKGIASLKQLMKLYKKPLKY